MTQSANHVARRIVRPLADDDGEKPEGDVEGVAGERRGRCLKLTVNRLHHDHEVILAGSECLDVARLLPARRDNLW